MNMLTKWWICLRYGKAVYAELKEARNLNARSLASLPAGRVALLQSLDINVQS